MPLTATSATAARVRFSSEEEIARLDRLIGTVGGAPRVAVGFSGGGDSTALLHLAVDWARATGGAVAALIVDHALRPGSAADAAAARAAARAVGVEAEILTWTDRDRAPRQADARAARHRLLAEACARRGVRALALGHTADDVAETLAMRTARLARPRGLAGLAEIAPSPAWPEGRDLAIVRPFLGETRASVRRRLAAAGVSWIDDPANEEPAFERVRVRRALAALRAVGADVARLRAVTRAAARADAAERDAAAALLARAARVEADGWIVLDRARFADAPGAARRRALEAVLGAAAGRPGPLSAEALDRLGDALGPERAFAGATLGGAAVAPAGESVVVARDPGALLGRVDRAAEPAGVCSGVWDGRFNVPQALRNAERIVPAEIVRNRLSPSDREALSRFPALARRTAPVAVGPAGRVRLFRRVFIGSQAIARRLFPERPQTWCDKDDGCG